ncbi:MAG: nitrate transporter [Halomonadaceae bacterium]|nr:MAG: nitrate transporter [Halomonadaceae bacterium]
MTEQPLHLGYMPLLDAAPLIIARELGLFRQQGLQVQLHREVSWASLRDKVGVGALHGGQMLSPMTLAAQLGLGAPPIPLTCAMVLSRNGNGITVSRALHDELLASGHDLSQPPMAARALAQCAARRQQPLLVGIVYAWSSHYLQLLDWLATAGLAPGQEIRVITVPPDRMTGALARGEIDMACVGEPWNSLAELDGTGHLLVTGHQIWQNAPEKVLGIRSDWQQANPQSHERLLMALIQACRWLDNPVNRPALLDILALPPYLDQVITPLGQRGSALFHPRIQQHFFRQSANFPWLSQFRWLLNRMTQRGQIPGQLPAELPVDLFRPDLYRQAAEALSLDTPVSSEKEEGSHAHPFTVPGHKGPIEVGADTLMEK